MSYQQPHGGPAAGFPYPQAGYPGGEPGPYPPQGGPLGFVPGPYPPQGAPPVHPTSQVPYSGGTVAVTDTNGNYEGVQYRIDHRDSNSLLSLRLHPDYVVKGKPGSMVAMDASVKIKGKMKFSMKKLFTGGEMAESLFTGPGEVLLAPEVWGDIVPIQVDGSSQWSLGRDAFLAATHEIKLTTKSQGFGKALFSGEGLFVAQATGRGIIFVQSLGAVVKRTLAPKEQWIVDNGHLVAWSAKYSVERINAGGFISSSHTDEGLVCRFTGPGTVYIQTRNPETLTGWIADQLPSSSG